MLLIETGIVLIILILILVVLWSGLTYQGFSRSLQLGVPGIGVFVAVLTVYVAAVAAGFIAVYTTITDPLVRGGALLMIPMFLGIPFRMVIATLTRTWIRKRFLRKYMRSATNADIMPVTELIYDVLREYGLKPDPEFTDADLKDIEGNYLQENGSFDVLLDADGKIIGSVGILRLDEQKCELRKMYLKVSERGKGYGKLLLECGLQRASELGYKRVILETASVLKEAISLYGQYGFKRMKADNPSGRCDQMYYLELEK